MLRQRHKRYDACVDIRYHEPFFYISKMGWNERFWTWASNRMYGTSPRTDAVLEGRGHVMTNARRYHYTVHSTEMYVPLMLCENPKFAGTYEEPVYYVLEAPHRESTLLREQIMMIWDALQSPVPRNFETVNVDKMAQLARAGSTARWVANKMQGKYDGEES